MVRDHVNSIKLEAHTFHIVRSVTTAHALMSARFNAPPFVLLGTQILLGGMIMEQLIHHYDQKVVHYKALLIPTLGLFALSAK